MSVPDVAQVATAVLEESGLTELAPEAAVDLLPITLPAVPAQTTAAEPVPVGAVAAPPPEPAAETPARATPAPDPAPDAPPATTVAQTAPANVNVSVRVDSPGDDGAVEQVNAAAAAGGAQYQPSPSQQYQQPIPTPDAPAPEQTSQGAPTDPTAEAGGWNWTWEWNCGDSAPEIPLPADVGTQNWTWNWNWNCGGQDAPAPNSPGANTTQYQPATTQYRPININISIRINSPGNNGAVLQTNVAVALTPPALPQLRVETPVAASNQAQSSSGGFDPLAPLAAVIAVMDGIGMDPAEPAPETDDCCVASEPRGVAAAPSEPQSLLLPQAPPASARDITPRDRFQADVAVTIRLTKATQAAARSARPAPEPAQLRPAPAPRRPARETQERAAALSAAGLAPVGAPDGRLGYVVLLVAAFAFAIAFADASRSVAAEVRAAGEDPDPPPDHPG